MPCAAMRCAALAASRSAWQRMAAHACMHAPRIQVRAVSTHMCARCMHAAWHAHAQPAPAITQWTASAHCDRPEADNQCVPVRCAALCLGAMPHRCIGVCCRRGGRRGHCGGRRAARASASQAASGAHARACTSQAASAKGHHPWQRRACFLHRCQRRTQAPVADASVLYRAGLKNLCGAHLAAGRPRTKCRTLSWTMPAIEAHRDCVSRRGA